ncbi:hypothetical protein EPUS_00330 [Endocarpon pusillum Z07020]|uniref:Uncharacterized protein n=1 Tax=Endocarpon pusillum (strain Z07020 / HMAS-L-300199) TaxID=1263415 RepID=U1GDL0_ENDPU|nr:uncharacterized protein EPUS_00330 [Endocarpon pusillum Z07020]ERF70143.1 hypothetical protein EPUS_00330 [Endocarpon pusillum Z07020]
MAQLNALGGLWPEIVKATGYLDNRTPKRQLEWRTSYESLLKQKPNLAHLRTYGCRAYPLNKHIPRLQKLQLRAYIGYLVGYESTNIYRIWIPSLEKVVRTRDVTFNEELFYDPAELDIGHLLRESTNQVIEILEIPSMAAAEPNSRADTEEEEERERGARSAGGENDSPSASTPNSTAAPTPCDSSASGTLSNCASTPSENRSDFDSRNILPEGSKRSRMSSRRQNYAAALAQTTELTPFYAAFAAGHEKSGKIDGLHRDTLPTELRSWKQMTKHKFATEFKLAANREIQELARRETFKWVNKEAVTAMPLPLLWVFKYKFDTDGYLIKFKARLCVRGDLQSTEQDTYAATLAAPAAFDLDIRQYDAVNAFVNSKLNERIFCIPPEGYKRSQQSWLLLRALYGLKQSPLL